MTATAEISEPVAESPAASPTPSFHFSSASALSSARQESLENWHRQFLRTASGSLADLLRQDLDLELASVQIQTYGEMVKERGEDNQCVLFRMHPQPGIWLMDVPVTLSLLLVERMMGGPGVLPTGKAPDLTQLEQTVFQQFAETFLADYARNWRPHAELKADILRQVRNLNYQLIHQADDLILRVGVRAVFKGGNAVLWLVVPIASVEDLLLRTLAPAAGAKPEEPVLNKDKKSPLGSVPIPVSLRWQGFDISLREVEAMAPGDVLVLDNRKCDQVAIWLGNIAKFEGRLVREAQKTTVTITRPLE